MTSSGIIVSDSPSAFSQSTGEITAAPHQMAILNNKLPKGFRFESFEKVQKLKSLHKPGKRKKPGKREQVTVSDEGEDEKGEVYAEIPQKPRHSTREKKPHSISDLGYTNKDQLKKAGKGAAEAFRKCEKILSQLRKHPYAAHFLYPVSVPGYTEVIKEPMDIATVEKKLRTGTYLSPNSFAADVRKIWNNAWTYNQPGSEIYIATTNISDFFEGLMKEVEDVQFVAGGSDEIQELKKRVNKVNGVLKKIASTAPMIPIQRAPSSGSRRPTDRPMSSKEKAALGQNIRKLTQEQVLEMLQILREVVDLSKAKDGVELDLEKLPTKKCRELDQYVKRALSIGTKSKPKSKKPKTEPTSQPGGTIDHFNEGPKPPIGPLPSTSVNSAGSTQGGALKNMSFGANEEHKSPNKESESSDSESSFDDDEEAHPESVPQNYGNNRHQPGTPLTSAPIFADRYGSSSMVAPISSKMLSDTLSHPKKY